MSSESASFLLFRYSLSNLILSILASVIVIVPDQMAEALRIVFEKDLGSGKGWLDKVVFLLGLTFCSFSIWWSTRESLSFVSMNETPSSLFEYLQKYLPFVYGIFPLGASVIAMYYALPAFHNLDVISWENGDIVFAVVYIALIAFVLYLCTRLGPLSYSVMRVWGTFGGAFLVYLCIAMLVALNVFAYESVLNTPGVVFLWVATLVPIVSVIANYSIRTRTPFLLILIILAFSFSYFDWNDNHAIRTLSKGNTDFLSGKSIDHDFSSWITKHKSLKGESNDKANAGANFPVIFVAAEGGGIRAAFLTSYTLATLYDYCPKASDHIYAISGVSGGSLGAAYFTALLRSGKIPHSSDCNAEVAPNSNMRDAVIRLFQNDLLTPTVTGLLYPDFVQRFLPFPVEGFSRARAFELALERHWASATDTSVFSQSFYSLPEASEERKAPILLLNTTRVGIGDRMIIGNRFLTGERFNNVQNFGDTFYDIRLSTAVSMSARFPLIMPAGSFYLHGRKERVVDGGYFENSGATTLTDLLHVTTLGDRYKKKALQKQQEKNIAFKPMVLMLRNGEAAPNYGKIYEKRAHQLDNYGGRGFGELLSPVRALLNTRVARGDYAVKRLESYFNRLLDNDASDDGMVLISLTKGKTPIPLGWVMSEAAKSELINQIGEPKSCGENHSANSCLLRHFIEEFKK